MKKIGDCNRVKQRTSSDYNSDAVELLRKWRFKELLVVARYL